MEVEGGVERGVDFWFLGFGWELGRWGRWNVLNWVGNIGRREDWEVEKG